MLNILYRLYFWRLKPEFLDDFYGRFLNRVINEFAPLCFTLADYFPIGRIGNSTVHPKIVVSLTSFPARINTAWLTIQSLFYQKRVPDAILLWLSKMEFPDENALPENLLRLKAKGLQIRFCEDNIMPHKKYFYAFKEFPTDIIITVDDDMIYPNSLISNLIKHNILYPDAICCSITRKIAVSNLNILPYREWEYVHSNTKPTHQNLVMGGGGTLFPAGSLSDEVFNLVNLKKLALRTDDLWLKIMAVRNNTKVVSLAGEYSRFFVTIRNSQKETLMHDNIREGNDRQFRELLNVYGIDPLIFRK